MSWDGIINRRANHGQNDQSYFTVKVIYVDDDKSLIWTVWSSDLYGDLSPHNFTVSWLEFLVVAVYKRSRLVFKVK